MPLGGGTGSYSVVDAGAGSAGAPSLSFSGDPDTGLYDASSNNTISIAAGGAKIFDLSSAGIVSPTTGGGLVTKANGTAAAPTFSFAGDTGTGWWRPAASMMAASTGGTERVRIDSSGNVGIGTPSPGKTLDVRGGAYANNQNIGIQLGVPTGQWVSRFSIKSDASGVARTAIDATDGTTGGTTNEAISIDVTGKVGIGTTSPQANLQINAAGNTNQLMLTGLHGGIRSEERRVGKECRSR